MRKIVEAPNDRIDLSAQLAGHCSELAAQPTPVDGTNEEEIDIAAELVRAGSVGTEEEGELNTWCRSQGATQALRGAGRSAHDIADTRDERTVLGD